MDVTVCQVWQQVQQGRECHPQPAGARAWPHPEREPVSGLTAAHGDADMSVVDPGGLIIHQAVRV